MSQKNFTVDGGLEVYGGAVFNSDVNLNNNKIINVGTPVNAGDLVNKAYVDAITGNASESNPLSWTSIADKPTTIAGFGITDAFSGSWNDLTDVPDGVGGTIDWLNITNKPTFFSGRYQDLTGQPFIPTDINQLTDANNLLSVDVSNVVAKSGDTMTGTLNITGVANAIVADNDIRAGKFLLTGVGGLQTDGATDTVVFASNNLRIRAGGDQIANEAINVNGTTGAVTISGLRYPTTDGTNGQVLGTNGSGVLSWVTSISGTSYTDADVATYLNGNLNTHILPDTNEAYDLGSAMYKFRDLYLSGNTIHLGETRISRDDTTGDIRMKGADNKLRSVRVKSLEIEDDDIDTSTRTVMRKINGRMKFVHVDRVSGAETVQEDIADTNGVDTTGAAAGQVLSWDGSALTWTTPATGGSGGSADPATPILAGTMLGKTTSTTIQDDANAIVALGYQAQKNGGGGIAIGTQIGLYSPNTLTGNIAIGSQNLLMASTATRNVTVGMNSLRNLTTGTENMAVGNNTGYGMKHASRNTMIGYGSMPFYAPQVDGTEVNDNTAIGRASLNSVTGLEADGTTPRRTTGNIVVGNNGMFGMKAGRGNSALGGGAASDLIYGDYNTFMGAEAAKTLTGGDYNIIIGALSTPSSATVNGEITIGDAVATSRLRIPGVGLDTADAVDGKFLSWNAGKFAWVDAPASTGGGSFDGTIDATNGLFFTAGGGSSNITGAGNVAIGVGTLSENLTTGTHNIAIGENSGLRATGNHNVLLGYRVGRFVTGNENIGIGSTSLYQTTTGARNVAIGFSAGNQLTTGTDNMLLGRYAGYGIGAGKYNSLIGANAGFNVVGDSITAVGQAALQGAADYNSAAYSTAVGMSSGKILGRDGVATYNTLLGFMTGSTLAGGVHNLVLGALAEPSNSTVNGEITLGSTHNSRLRIPGLGFDTADASNGNTITWQNGEMVWTDPTTGGGGTGLDTTSTSTQTVAGPVIFDKGFDTYDAIDVYGNYVGTVDADGNNIAGHATVSLKMADVDSNNVPTGSYTTAAWFGIPNYTKDFTFTAASVNGGRAFMSYEYNNDLLRLGAGLGHKFYIKDNTVAAFNGGVFTGNGSGLTDVNATTLDGLDGSAYVSPANAVLSSNFMGLYGTDYAEFRIKASNDNSIMRIYHDAGTTQYQHGSNGGGEAQVSGNAVFTGYYGADIGNFQVKYNGSNRDILHTGNVDSVATLVTTTKTNDFNRNIIKNAIISATPESDMVMNPGFTNDWAFARLRGATATITNATPSNSQIDNLFDAKATTTSFVPGAAEADAVVLEFTNMPKTLNYSQWVGFSFGAHWNRCKGVKIETYSSQHDRWETQFYTTTNDSEIITTPCHSYKDDAGASLGGGKSTNGIRISLWDPASSSTRIANIFGWDYNATLGTSMYVDRTGGTVYGTITQTSDARIKTDVVTIENALDKVNAMRGVTFTNTITGEENQVGVIAQEMEAVIPELVHTDEETDQKSVAYSNTVAVLIEAVKELTAKVEAQQAEINALKGQ